MIKYPQKYVLENGLNVIYLYDTAMPILSTELWVKIGSCNESSSNNGISHFLEHMVFKDTVKYKNNSLSREIEKIGGNINAATSLDFTYFYTEVLSKEYEKSFSILSEIAGHCIINTENMNKEKGVVIEEIMRGHDNPGNVFWEFLYSKIFPEHAYARPVIGTKENIVSMTDKDLFDYYSKNYIPSNMTFVVVGDLDRQKLDDAILKYFNFAKKDSKLLEENSTSQMNIDKTEYHKMSMKINQTYFAYVWDMPVSRAEKDFYAMQVLASILGKGISSRLYQRIHEDKFLAWNIAADLIAHKDANRFVIYGACDIKNLTNIEKEMKDILNEILFNNPVVDEELQKAMRIFELDYWNDLETYSDISYQLGYNDVVYGDSNLVYNFLENIKNITKDDLKNCVEKYLTKNYKAITLEQK